MGTSSSFASERDSVNRKSPGEEEKGKSLIAPLSPRRRRRKEEGDGDGSFHLLLLKLAPKVGQRTLPTYLVLLRTYCRGGGINFLALEKLHGDENNDKVFESAQEEEGMLGK